MLRRGIFLTISLMLAAGCGPLIALMMIASGGQEPSDLELTTTAIVQLNATTETQLRMTQTQAASAGSDVTTYTSLVESLRGAGLTVEPAGEIDQPFFRVSGRVIVVAGGDVQVYEYESSEAAESDAKQISPSGSPIGTSMISWMAPPHFYRTGKLMALYLGNDPQVMTALEAALGPQFAGQ